MKRDSHGNVERYKVRQVIKGFQQRKAVDFSNVFSHIVSKAALRIFVTLATIQDLEVEQLDIKIAFLDAEIQEEIYMAVS